MLEGFTASDFGREVTANCIREHFIGLPPTTKLVILFGLGNNSGDGYEGQYRGEYVESCYELFRAALPGDWRRPNNVSYLNGDVSFVHVEHFAPVMKNHRKNWLDDSHPRSNLARAARQVITNRLL